MNQKTPATRGFETLDINPVRDPIHFYESLGLHSARITEVDVGEDDPGLCLEVQTLLFTKDGKPGEVITSSIKASKPGDEAFVLYDSDSERVLEVLYVNDGLTLSDAQFAIDSVIKTLRWRIGRGQTFKEAISAMFPKALED